MKYVFCAALLGFCSVAAQASTCVVGAGDGQQSIVTVCDGKQLSEVDVGEWPDYLIKGTNAINKLVASGYKIVSQSGGENGLIYWTLQK